MKTLKIIFVVSIFMISSTAFATGSKREPPKPPQEPTIIEKIIEVITGKKIG
jgi:hypothetical protein